MLNKTCKLRNYLKDKTEGKSFLAEEVTICKVVAAFLLISRSLEADLEKKVNMQVIY